MGMEVLPLPNVSTMSKKRKREVPLDTPSIVSLPSNVVQEPMAAVVDKEFNPNGDETPPRRTSLDTDGSLSRSLMGLSLQLKLKMMIVEAWASDMNSVVMERNLFAIAKELATLSDQGIYPEDTCLRFLELARSRMNDLLCQTERSERLQMQASQMWTMAQVQSGGSSPSVSNEFPLLSGNGFDASSRDLTMLWKAMSLAKDRGAQLWHENKTEQALPFLIAADSYMKRFTLKYQKLKVDHAMLESFHDASNDDPKQSKVRFMPEPEVLGVADADVDRRPISPSKPSKLESLLLRTSRAFPTPNL